MLVFCFEYEAYRKRRSYSIDYVHVDDEGFVILKTSCFFDLIYGDYRTDT